MATSLAAGLVPLAHAQRQAHIEIHVRDQNSVDYQGVNVQIWRNVLVDAGNTDYNGLWISQPLDGDGRFYEVRVFNGARLTRDVQIVAADVFLEFNLTRLAPAPQLIVSKVTYSPLKPVPGDRFNATLEVENVGSEEAATSFLSVIALPPKVSLLQAGSTFYLGRIEAGGSQTLTLTMITNHSIIRDSYLLQYNLTYSNEANYEYSSLGSFGLLLSGAPAIQISNLIVDPPTLNPGTNGVLTVRLVNTGNDAAKDILVHVQHPGILTSDIAYSGDIDVGNSISILLGIYVSPRVPVGLSPLNITISYKNSAGNSYLTSNLFVLAVVPTEGLPLYDLPLVVLSSLLVLLVVLSLRRLGFKL